MVNLPFLTKPTPDYYSDLKIPVFNFHEALKGNLNYLWVNKPGKKDLSEVWKEIYNLYCKAAKIDNRHLKQYAKVDALILKHKIIAGLLDVLQLGSDENIVKACEILKKHNYLIDVKKPIRPQYERCVKQLNSLHTKIKIEQDKLPKEQKKEAVSLMKQVVGLKSMFQGYQIDIYTTTMEEWIALLDMANERVQQQSNSRK